MKNPIVIFAILMIASILGGYYIYSSYLSPEMDRRAAENTKNAELYKKLDEAKQAEAHSAELQKQIESMNSTLESLKGFMPVRAEIGKTISNLNRVAQESNLRILKLDPQPGVADHGFYTEESMKMSVTGGYHDIAVYFDKIGRFRRIITIRNVSMKRSSEGGLGGRKVAADFEAATYLQKPVPPPDANPAPHKGQAS